MPKVSHPPLLHALKDARCYPHPVRRIRMLETPGSWMILTGPYAYKIGKPLPEQEPDCSTLGAQRFACEQALRLNTRIAPDLYIGVVEIRGSLDAPRIEGDHGPAIGYALKMREFPRRALASRMLARGSLTAELVDDLARRIAAFHAGLEPLSRRVVGTPGQVYRRARSSIQHIEQLSPEAETRELLDSLRAWIDDEFVARSRDFQMRWEAGRVREGCGDLRLDKVALLDGKLVPFGCEDASPEVRWSDVMVEVAALLVDLKMHGAAHLAQVFLNAYLAESSDYAGLAVLRFHAVERALSLARGRFLDARAAPARSLKAETFERAARQALAIAHRDTSVEEPAVVVTCGVPHGHRTDIARALAQTLGCILVAPCDGVGQAAGRDTEAGLAQRTEDVLRAGYSAVADAPCLHRSDRTRLKAVASSSAVPLVFLRVHPSEDLLRAARLAEFVPVADGSSRGRLLVLERELAESEVVDAAEGLVVIHVNGSSGISEQVLRQIRSAVAAQRPQGALEAVPASFST